MITLEDYRTTLCGKVFISYGDMSQVEKELIDTSYKIFKDRLADLSAAEDRVKSLETQLKNAKELNKDLLKENQELKKKKEG